MGSVNEEASSNTIPHFCMGDTTSNVQVSDLSLSPFKCHLQYVDVYKNKNSPGSLYTSWKSPATIEKSESAGRLCGLTSGKDTGLVWSEDILLLLNW